MRIISSITDIGCEKIGMTIGNFDGVHLGHRDFLDWIKKDCKENDLSLLVVTFRPHPGFVIKNRNPFLINSYDERVDFLKYLDVDYLWEMPFDFMLSKMGPEKFLQNYFLDKSVLLKKIYVGHDFSFGNNKQGTYNHMRDFCQKKLIDYCLFDAYKHNGQVVSSTVIRELLLDGNVYQAREFLNREFFITGEIVKGDGRGRILGYKTANLKIDPERMIPKCGVYITKTLYNGLIYDSLTSVGYNPTFKNLKDGIRIETHILNFDKEIYGEMIRVFFVERIRDEKKFLNKEDLIEQIASDVKIAQEYNK